MKLMALCENLRKNRKTKYGICLPIISDFFLRWVIENGMESDESDKEDCEKVRNGQMSGTEYL
ncbi:MAG: hypothetical protein K2J39_09230 [Ruminococcus sp.]|nr:hypothetical protein [Ruminococcus sp.]